MGGSVDMIKARAEKSPQLYRLLAGVRDWGRRWRRRLLLPARLLRRRFQLRAYLRSESEPRLNIGCGPNPERGWLNCDLEPQDRRILYLDASLPFPLPSDTFAYVYAEHLIEHLDRRGVVVLLREAFRVLRPGGVIRLATPDLEKYARYYAGTLPDMAPYARWIGDRYLKDPDATPAEVLNNLFHNFGHRHLFDQPTLRKFLASAGFGEIARVEVGRSLHAALAGLERHGSQIPEEFNRLETLVVEARKPDTAT